MMWDGTTKAETLKDVYAQKRHRVADAAKRYNWNWLFEIIGQDRRLANSTRPDGTSLYAPLHQVAHGGASPAIAQRIIDMGAWRTLPTAQGERPLDIARRKGYRHLEEVLTPVYKTQVPPETLAVIQTQFHRIIRERAEELVRRHALRLPELAPLLELEEPRMSFPVPGMYGGFYYHLDGAGEVAILICESWSRVVTGSGQRHHITAKGSALVEEGFV